MLRHLFIKDNMVSIVISSSINFPREISNSRLFHIDDKNDVSHVPIGTFPVSDSSYSLAKLKEGDEEGGQNITTMQSNGHTS